MQIKYVIAFLTLLALGSTQEVTKEVTGVPETSTEPSHRPGPNKPKTFLGFSEKWPFTFDSEKARAEIPDIEKIIKQFGSLWNVISGLIDMIGDVFSGKGKKSKSKPDDGDY